jgi:hypothetical protein
VKKLNILDVYIKFGKKLFHLTGRIKGEMTRSQAL